jgi:hypothetical protein
MAKIKFGAVITDSRGHIGGVAYKWSRYGNIASRVVTPVHHMTPATQRARTFFALYSQRWWSVLTSTQRDDWRALAAANPRPNVWGTEFPLTGHALFIGVNSLLRTAGFAAVDDAPASQTVVPLSTMTLSVTAPNVATVTFTPTPLPSDHVLYIRGRSNFSPGVLNIAGLTSFVDVSATEETSTYDLSSAWLARFGNIISGRQCAILASTLNTANGALSAPLIGFSVAS